MNFKIKEKLISLRYLYSRYRFPKLLVLFVLLLALPVGVYLSTQVIKYLTKAVGEPVNVYFDTSTTLPPNPTVRIRIDAKTNSVAFARVVFTFDTTKVRLSGEITPGTSLGRIIEKTSMADANLTGRATIVLGSSPNSTSPTGIFEFASFPLSVYTSQQNTTTVLNFVSADMQVVEKGVIDLGITTSATTLNLNPVASPTPTPRPTATPTPVTATSTPSPYIQGDLDHDGDVDINDYNLLVSVFGQVNCTYNILGTCTIDIYDYNILVGNYGRTVTPTPTQQPTPTPTRVPTQSPTNTPTLAPTRAPTPTPTSSGGATIVLNSATGKTCTTVCSDLVKTCSSVGLDSQATNGNAWGYDSIRGCFSPILINCSNNMRDAGRVCSGQQANWTQCRCL